MATDKEGKEFQIPFEWQATYVLGFVAAHWCRSLKGDFYCAFCTSKEKHHPLKCPLLGQLGLELINISGQGGGGTPGAYTGTPPLAGACGGSKGSPPHPAATPAVVVFPPAQASGSSSAPVGLTAAVEENAVDDKTSTDSFLCYYPYYPTRILRLFKHNLTSY